MGHIAQWDVPLSYMPPATPSTPCPQKQGDDPMIPFRALSRHFYVALQPWLPNSDTLGVLPRRVVVDPRVSISHYGYQRDLMGWHYPLPWLDRSVTNLVAAARHQRVGGGRYWLCRRRTQYVALQ